jgi:hypothetical protein
LRVLRFNRLRRRGSTSRCLACVIPGQPCLEFDNEGAAAGESGPSKRVGTSTTCAPKMRASTPGNVRRDSGDARRPPRTPVATSVTRVREPALRIRTPTVRVRIQQQASPPNRERGNPKGVCQGRPESGHTPDMLGSGTFAKDALKRKIFGWIVPDCRRWRYTRPLIAHCPGSFEFSRSNKSGRTRRERDVEAERRASTADERPG